MKFTLVVTDKNGMPRIDYPWGFDNKIVHSLTSQEKEHVWTSYFDRELRESKWKEATEDALKDKALFQEYLYAKHLDSSELAYPNGLDVDYDHWCEMGNLEKILSFSYLDKEF